MNPSERIDQLIAGLTDWRGKTLAGIRKSILAADREILEESAAGIVGVSHWPVPNGNWQVPVSRKRRRGVPTTYNDYEGGCVDTSDRFCFAVAAWHDRGNAVSVRLPESAQKVTPAVLTRAAMQGE